MATGEDNHLEWAWECINDYDRRWKVRPNTGIWRKIEVDVGSIQGL